MKVLILWSNWSGYMDASARALQTLTGCELDIVVPGGSCDAPYDQKGFFQYEANIWPQSQGEAIGRLLEKSYDLALICGWHIPVYIKAAKNLAGKAPRVLCMDNQWLGTFRQYLGIAAFQIRLKNLFEYAFVPGWRQAVFANKLGFPVNRIIEGHYSCDTSKFDKSNNFDQLQKSFLFTGRLVPEKGIDVLAAAWENFCQKPGLDEWTMAICGTGPLMPQLSSLERVTMHGFVQPSELPEVMQQSAAFVLPSKFEPWGLVVHEAASSGLPLIVTDQCGAIDYFLRPGRNGYRIRSNDAAALSQALFNFAILTDDERVRMGKLSQALGRQRSPETWACAVTMACN